MTNPSIPYAYYGENALNLYHFFVNELESKITNEHLNVGNIHLLIEYSGNDDRGEHDWQIMETCVRYIRPEHARGSAQFSIRFQRWEGETPLLEIYHIIPSQYTIFEFQLNNLIVKEQPSLCFNKWMEIAVNDMPLVQQGAEFDNFLQNKKEARNLKYKMDLLLRYSNKRPSSRSVWNSIISNEYLRSEIYKNGSKHL